MTPREEAFRREKIAAMLVLFRGARRRGNGFAFGSPAFAYYLPRGVR